MEDMTTIAKEEFVDIVSQIIMNDDCSNMSYEETANDIWVWLISKKIKLKLEG